MLQRILAPYQLELPHLSFAEQCRFSLRFTGEYEQNAFAVALTIRFFAYFVYLSFDIGDSDANGDEDIGASSRGNERHRSNF